MAADDSSHPLCATEPEPWPSQPVHTSCITSFRRLGGGHVAAPHPAGVDHRPGRVHPSRWVERVPFPSCHRLHLRWNLTAGQLVIVDEPSLTGTLLLDQVTAHARVGAKVLVARDPSQLAAVDAGGTFGMLVRDHNSQLQDHGWGCRLERGFRDRRGRARSDRCPV